MFSNLLLQGMVSLVTGGASGLGKATVERFVKHGGNVVILDLQATRAQEVAKRLGDNVLVSPGSVSFLFVLVLDGHFYHNQLMYSCIVCVFRFAIFLYHVIFLA